MKKTLKAIAVFLCLCFLLLSCSQDNILKTAELDPDHGLDSEVFFHGATPSYELLKQYHAPLSRLKDS